jgi:hypothetical protein
MAVGRLIIKSSEPFRGLNAATIDYLAVGSDVEAFRDGDWVYEFSSAHQALQVVHLGAVQASLRNPAGEVCAWTVVGPRQCIPNSSLLPFTPWLSGARCIAETSVVVVPFQRLQAIMIFSPQAARSIARNMQRLTRRWRSQLQKVVPDSAAGFVTAIPCPFDVPTAQLQLSGDIGGEGVRGVCKRQPFCTVEACPIAGRPADQLALFWTKVNPSGKRGIQGHT